MPHVLKDCFGGSVASLLHDSEHIVGRLWIDLVGHQLLVDILGVRDHHIWVCLVTSDHHAYAFLLVIVEKSKVQLTVVLEFCHFDLVHQVHVFLVIHHRDVPHAGLVRVFVFFCIVLSAVVLLYHCNQLIGGTIFKREEINILEIRTLVQNIFDDDLSFGTYLIV